MIRYCTVGKYAVSTTSGTGIDGVILNVHISGTFPLRHCEGHGKRFANVDDADAYCLAKGYIREYRG